MHFKSQFSILKLLHFMLLLKQLWLTYLTVPGILQLMHAFLMQPHNLNLCLLHSLCVCWPEWRASVVVSFSGSENSHLKRSATSYLSNISFFHCWTINAKNTGMSKWQMLSNHILLKKEEGEKEHTFFFFKVGKKKTTHKKSHPITMKLPWAPSLKPSKSLLSILCFPLLIHLGSAVTPFRVTTKR